MTNWSALRINVALVICGFSVSALAGAPSAAAPEQGVWQKHEYSFQYFGFTTTYSCEGLASKVRVLLIAAGARADAKSLPGVCTRELGGADKFSRATLRFYTLAPAGSADNASPPTNSTWRSVRFANLSPREVTLGDCELIEQFRDKVLPMFTTRNVDSRMACTPNQLTGSSINLTFEVFTGIPVAKS